MEGRRGKGIGLTWINLAAKEPTDRRSEGAAAAHGHGSGACVRACVRACMRARAPLHKVDISKIDGRVACSESSVPSPPRRNAARARLPPPGPYSHSQSKTYLPS